MLGTSRFARKVKIARKLRMARKFMITGKVRSARQVRIVRKVRIAVVRWQTLEMTDFIGHFCVGGVRPISQQDPLTDHSSKTFQPKKIKSDRASRLAQFFCKTCFFKGKRPKISKNRPTSTVLCG